MNRFRYISKFLRHFFSARHTKGFGVHSPFVFHFICFVIYEKHQFYVFTEIENLRKVLLNDKRKLKICDFGTGSDRNDTVANVARKALKSKKFAQLLFRIANYLKAENILEIGTSLGITTSYLASSAKSGSCITLEGSCDIAEIATCNFEKLGLKNIEIVTGNIDKTLPSVFEKINTFDLIFIDANHTFSAVVNYFNQCVMHVHDKSIVVIDDIYWSNGMEKAWNFIKSHPKVITTIDLFQMGIVIFDPNLSKKHYKMIF